MKGQLSRPAFVLAAAMGLLAIGGIFFAITQIQLGGVENRVSTLERTRCFHAVKLPGAQNYKAVPIDCPKGGGAQPNNQGNQLPGGNRRPPRRL